MTELGNLYMSGTEFGHCRVPGYAPIVPAVTSDRKRRDATARATSPVYTTARVKPGHAVATRHLSRSILLFLFLRPRRTKHPSAISRYYYTVYIVDRVKGTYPPRVVVVVDCARR